MERRRPKTGEIYRHFRGKRYRILHIAVSTETREEMVVYETVEEPRRVYVSILNKFLEEVDRGKYPDSEQRYRFEKERGRGMSEKKPEAFGGVKTDDEHALILQFLDLESNEARIEFLQRRRTELTERFLTATAESLEYAESGDSLEERYAGLLRFLKTKVKYESSRLRG